MKCPHILILLMISVICLYISNATYGGDFGVGDRLEKTVQCLRAVTNIEIHGVDQQWIAKGGYTSKSQFEFIVSGKKYRKETSSTSSDTNVIKFFEVAYDGTLLSTFNRDAGYMIQSSHDQLGDTSPGPENPLIANLMFLSKNSDDCKGCRLMFNAIYSEDLLKGVNLTNVEKHGDLLQISVPGHITDGRATRWEIVMGTKGEQFTPESITHIVPLEGAVTYRFLTYSNLSLHQESNESSQTLSFPSLISYSATAYLPRQSGAMLTGLITVVSADMPQHIPDSTFRLDENEAKIIWSADKRDAIKGKPIIVENEAKNRMAELVVLGALIVSSVLFAIVLIRRGR